MLAWIAENRLGGTGKILENAPRSKQCFYYGSTEQVLNEISWSWDAKKCSGWGKGLLLTINDSDRFRTDKLTTDKFRLIEDFICA
jgi:hypothetical protein